MGTIIAILNLASPARGNGGHPHTMDQILSSLYKINFLISQ
jgi:hypothetical protein